MHPLAGDFSGMKDSELESKITDLTNKYFMTANTGVKSQISALLDTYKEELSKRQKAAWDKMMANRDKSLDKLVKIS
jgi:hypothetical protein